MENKKIFAVIDLGTLNLKCAIFSLDEDSSVKLLGLSKKRFIKDLSGENDSRERFGGTISSCLYSMLQGIQILRVHDVNEVKQALQVFKKLQFN